LFAKIFQLLLTKQLWQSEEELEILKKEFPQISPKALSEPVM